MLNLDNNVFFVIYSLHVKERYKIQLALPLEQAEILFARLICSIALADLFQEVRNNNAQYTFAQGSQ
jgi:hypothetical protein